jgi:hypothetical protein
MNTDTSVPTLPLKNEGRLYECLLYYFPNLSEKEVIVCGMIVNGYHDLLHGSYAMIVATTARTTKYFKMRKKLKPHLMNLFGEE